MDVLDERPNLWGWEGSKGYEGAPEDFRQRLKACVPLGVRGDGIASFARLTGSGLARVGRWAHSETPPGWVEIVLQGIEAGVLDL